MDRGRNNTYSDTPHPDPKLHPSDYPMAHSNDSDSDIDLTPYLTVGSDSDSSDDDHPNYVDREDDVNSYRSLANRLLARAKHDDRSAHHDDANRTVNDPDPISPTVRRQALSVRKLPKSARLPVKTGRGKSRGGKSKRHRHDDSSHADPNPDPNPNPRHTVEVRSVEGKGVRYDVLAQECCGVWQHSESGCTPSPNPRLDPNPSHESKAKGKVRFKPGVNIVPNPPHATNTEPQGKAKVSHDAGKLDDGDRLETVREDVKTTLAAIRDLSEVERVREHYCSTLPAYTVFEQATGGCLDTIAAALAQFRHLGGSEDHSTPIGKAKARMFQELTNRRSFHDARRWEEWEGNIPKHFDYYKAGMPCPDYAALGKQLGCKGNKGGDLFILQLLFIECKLPKIVRLEMVPTALDTNDGDEVMFVLSKLSDLGYSVHAKVISCWEHGDPTARKRLFIIGISDTISDKAEWIWPEPVFDEARYPIARDVAVPDKQVPTSYWRHDRPTTYDRPLVPSKPGRIQHIGYAGDKANSDDAGYSTMPNNIQGWDGNAATQLGTNGGSRRVSLRWKPGEPIGDTRMSVPLETCRYASVHERSYMDLAKRHYPGKKSGISYDQWLRELVNLGVPIATGTAIDMAVHHALESAGVTPTDELGSARSCSHILPYNCDSEGEDNDDGLMYPMDTDDLCYNAKSSQGIQGLTISIGDSGASDNLGEHSTFASCINNPMPSHKRYSTAGDGTYIEGVVEGEIDISVLNVDSQPKCSSDWANASTTITTVRGLGESLFSLEAWYRDQGYDTHLSHGYHKGDYTGLYRPPERVQQKTLGKVFGPESFIPMVYNWKGQGGWKVPYVIRRPGSTDEQHKALLKSILDSERQGQCRKTQQILHANTYTQDKAQMLERFYYACPAVSEQLVVRTQGERNIRPAFTYGGLRRHKGSKWHDLHSNMAHLGEPGKPCTICSMYKGESRRMPKHRDGKPREARPGHTWYMDMITFRHRSEEGCKYTIVLTDSTTQFYQLIPLYWKSDATFEIRRWIRSMRGHPALKNLSYGMISRIITDNDGAWSEDNAEFQAMIDEVQGVEIEYGDPADHARDNARAEGANKIIEAGIQSLLYERNLPPTWWQRAANDVMFLANRLPVYSLDANVPSDGDYAPPIEQMFHGYVSRHQIYRELDSYVGVGTPALCHCPKVKGSDLEPKVRWGIAIGQRGKVTRWMCPFTHSQFKNRSFTAHTLRQGLNWSQFLGLGDIAPSNQSRMLPQDEGVAWSIELPEQRPSMVELPPPVREILDVHGENLSLLHPTLTSKDLCEFYPRLTKQDVRRLRDKDPDVDGSEIGTSDEEEVYDADVKSLEVVDDQGRQLDLVLREPLPGDDDEEQDNLHVEGCEHNHDSPDDPPSQSCPLEHPKPKDTRSTPHQGEPAKPKGKSGKGKGKGKKPYTGKKRGRKSASELLEQGVSVEDSLMDIAIDAYGIDESADAEMEEHEAMFNAKHTLVTDGKLTWARVCKHMNNVYKTLPHERHALYRIWLLTKPKRADESPLYVENLPRARCESRNPLDAGLTLPYPSGPHWNRLCSDHVYRKQSKDKLDPDELEEEQAYQAMRAYVAHLNKGYISLGLASKALIAEQVDVDEFQCMLDDMISDDIEDLGYTAYVARKYYPSARKARKLNKGNKEASITTAGDPAPKTIVEALMGDRAEQWVESIYKEFNGLCDQGVFSHDWSTKKLAKAGIVGKPVPCSVALTHKYKDGNLEKLKTRICVAGHRGNVTQGIHYHDVFSPSPIQHTERILQAMRVNLHLDNLTWDVKMAYTWAPLPPGERIAIVYPDGFKRHDENGEELFAVLEHNLYGMPSAGRGWGKHRDEFILERFNRKGWSCRRARSDPCLFVIDRDYSVEDPIELPHVETPKPNRRTVDTSTAHGESTGQDPCDEDLGSIDSLPPTTERSWVLIHTDDCDAYGTDLDTLHTINRIMDDKWTTEIVDSSFVLGVKRERTIHPNGSWSIKMSMPSFISDLYDVFREDIDTIMKRKVPKIPFPESVILSKSDTPQPGEVERNIKRGYQRLIGSLLWCVRHVSPISAYGCSQLCKLMATPTDLAFESAIHMLTYLYAHREEGIIFHETDSEPVAFVDASNKDDPTDGKTQYGYAIMWGGPLICKSSKLNHVGINSTYNEYMALHHCIKQVVWLRQLLHEIGLANYISKPTLVHADNKQANQICSEDLVTQGNMYFRTGYHYCKEAVHDMYCTVQYVDTALNISDTMTKGLGSNKINTFVHTLHGVEPLPDSLLTIVEHN